MIQAKDIKGTGVAVVTPFLADKSVDFKALENLVDYIIDGGVDYLVALGTTAETATLTAEEQMQVANCIFEQTAGRVPLLIGAGGNNTQTIVDKLQKDEVFTKFDGLLIATPYYNKPNQEGLYQHYAMIAQATEKPIVLYNVPGRTGVNMTSETTLRLANEFPQMIAVKEASGDLVQINEIICGKPSHFEVISGDDGLTFPMLSIGAIGVISVLANAFPKEMSAMVNAGLSYDFEKGKQLHNSLFALSQTIFDEGNPTGIKSLMAQKKLLQNELRLPLVSASESLTEKLKSLL